MSSSSNRILATWIVVALGAAACGNEDGASDTTTGRSAIYLGNNLGASELAASGLVAIYHPKQPDFPNFYPRPCSGVIVRSYGGLSTVLTARHCVTSDGSIYGPLADGSTLRLSPTLNPGPALPNPPPDAVPAWFVIDKLGASNDVAVVYVLVDWTSIGDNRIGLYVGDPRALVGATFTAYGYGITDPDGSCGSDNNSTGAGVARSGAYFTADGGNVWGDGQPDSYTYGATSSGGQSLYCGDSGGPDELTITGAGRMVLGVHQDAARMVGDDTSIAFDFGLQNRLGGLYLTPRSQASSDVMLAADLSTGTLEIVARGSAEQTTVSYDSAAKLLWMNNGCVSAANGSPPPLGHIAPCNTADPTQLWTVRTNGQLYNAAANRCLNAGSSGVTLGACVVVLFGRITIPASTLWLFHAQP